MSMFARKGGQLVPIPAEHEKILALYSDSMPYVSEPQYFGDHTLTPLFDLSDMAPRGEREAARAVEMYIRDEHLAMIADKEHPSETDRRDATAVARYTARKVQLFASEVVEKLTGEPMPTGVVEQGGMDTVDPTEAKWLAEVFPPLPPVGCPDWCDGGHDDAGTFHASRQIMMVPPADTDAPAEQSLVPQMKASLMVPTEPGERPCIYLRLDSDGDRSVELDLRGADEVLADLDTYRDTFKLMRNRLAQAEQEASR